MVEINKKFKIILIVGILIIAGIAGTITILTYASKPVLSNLIIEFGKFDANTNTSGDFYFHDYDDKIFLEFGAEVDDGEGGSKILPTFEYRVKDDADVISPCDGWVTHLEFQDDSDDYELYIKTNALSLYSVSIDHITDLSVSVGQFVRAGDLLGKPGTWHQEGVGRVELDIFSGSGTHHAPFAFFDSALKDDYEDEVWDFMEDWEDFKGDDSLYNEDDMLYAGCLYETLDESEL